jgi:hypothetical protein
MAAISDELDLARPGAAAISADLASALLVMVLRTHLAREDEFASGRGTNLFSVLHQKPAHATMACRALNH